MAPQKSTPATDNVAGFAPGNDPRQWSRFFAPLLESFTLVDGSCALYLRNWADPYGALSFVEQSLRLAAHLKPKQRAAITFYEHADARERAFLVQGALDCLRSPFAWGYYFAHARQIALPLPRYSLRRPVIWGTPLFNVAAASCPLDFLRLLRMHGASADQANKGGHTALHCAMLGRRSGFGIEEVIDYLLEQGVPIDARDEVGRSALHLAALRSMANACSLLIFRGADPSLGDKDGFRPTDYVPKGDSSGLRERLTQSALTRSLVIPTRSNARKRL